VLLLSDSDGVALDVLPKDTDGVTLADELLEDTDGVTLDALLNDTDGVRPTGSRLMWRSPTPTAAHSTCC
jgi:hypothetical protein